MQPREWNPVRCFWCKRPVWSGPLVCDSPRCREFEARSLARLETRMKNKLAAAASPFRGATAAGTPRPVPAAHFEEVHP